MADAESGGDVYGASGCVGAGSRGASGGSRMGDANGDSGTGARRASKGSYVDDVSNVEDVGVNRAPDQHEQHNGEERNQRMVIENCSDATDSTSGGAVASANEAAGDSKAGDANGGPGAGASGAVGSSIEAGVIGDADAGLNRALDRQERQNGVDLVVNAVTPTTME